MLCSLVMLTAALLADNSSDRRTLLQKQGIIMSEKSTVLIPINGGTLNLESFKITSNEPCLSNKRSNSTVSFLINDDVRGTCTIDQKTEKVALDSFNEKICDPKSIEIIQGDELRVVISSDDPVNPLEGKFSILKKSRWQRLWEWRPR